MQLSVNGRSSIYYIKAIVIYPLIEDLKTNLSDITQENAYDLIYDPTMRNYYDINSYNSFIDSLNVLYDDQKIDYCFADMIK